MRSRIAALAALLAVAGAFVSPLALPAPAIRGAVTHDVTIVDFAFDPADLTIQVGDTVRWTNSGGTDHTATSTSGPASFSSAGLATGATYEFTFTVAGVYDYQCSFHPSMTGRITVVAAATPTPVPSQNATAAPTESASAEETTLPDGSVPDRTGPNHGDLLLWALLSAVVLGGVAIAAARRV